MKVGEKKNGRRIEREKGRNEGQREGRKEEKV